MPLVDEIGNKSAGVLVRSADWNTLVAAVDTLSATLDQHVKELSVQIEDIGAQVQSVDSDLNTLEEKVAPLLQRTFFVTLATSKANFAIGELASIAIAVTDAAGKPVTSRPWVDLVVSWGQLRVVAPTTGLPGVGGRSLSVRTDDQGKAVVQVRADHVEGLNEDDEIFVHAALSNTVAATNKSAVATILEAATPNDANARHAFTVISEQYAVSSGMRNYVDSYYLENPLIVGGSYKPIEFGEWVDYRATVVAIAKSDSDSATPDQGHGVASTQLTFRDWIPGWFHLDFIDPPKLKPKVLKYIDAIEGAIGPEPRADLGLTIENIKIQVDQQLEPEEGILGKQRAFRAMHEALTTVEVPQALTGVIPPIQSALVFQHTLDSVATVPIAAGVGNVAFNTFTDVAAKQETTFSAVEGAVAAQVAQHVGQAKVELEAGLTTRQAEFQERILAGDGEVVQLVADRFKDVQETVVKLGQIDPDRLVAVDDLRERVNTLQTAFEMIR